MKQIFTLIFFTTASYLQCYSQTPALPDTINSKQNSGSLEVVEGNKITKIESEPEIDKDTWSKFLKKNINYDIAIFNDAPRGVYKVKVQFTVFADGHVGDVIALTKFGYGMEKEVIRALKKSPVWTPATQNGKAVDVNRIQNITFAVEVL